MKYSNKNFWKFQTSSNFSENSSYFNINSSQNLNNVNNKYSWKRSISIKRASEINSDQSLTSGSDWVLTVSLLGVQIDIVDIFLPSYSRCPISFMKQILSGEKMYTFRDFCEAKAWFLHFRFITNKRVVHLEIPKYPELATKNIWPLV